MISSPLIKIGSMCHSHLQRTLSTFLQIQIPNSNDSPQSFLASKWKWVCKWVVRGNPNPLFLEYEIYFHFISLPKKADVVLWASERDSQTSFWGNEIKWNNALLASFILYSHIALPHLSLHRFFFYIKSNTLGPNTIQRQFGLPPSHNSLLFHNFFFWIGNKSIEGWAYRSQLGENFSWNWFGSIRFGSNHI